MITYDFKTMVDKQITTIQSTASAILDCTVGSVLRAIIESNASMVMWVQSLIIKLLALTRASTSSDSDLDSWMADYNITRLPAMGATGLVTFSRFTPDSVAYVLEGVLVETMNGVQAYIVVADPTNIYYDSINSAYVLQMGVSELDILVKAITPGSTGNINSGAINTLTSSVPGIDTVVNKADFTNGSDAESDDDLRSRFVRYISSLSKGTMDAVIYCILGIKPNMNYYICENYKYDDTLSEGYFYVVIDDGTGAPNNELVASVETAINAIKPMGSVFGVYRPDIVLVTISAILIIAGTNQNAVRSAVSTNLVSFLNTLKLGEDCPYTMISQIIYNTSSDITNVTNITINGGEEDIIINNKQIIKSNGIYAN